MVHCCSRCCSNLGNSVLAPCCQWASLLAWPGAMPEACDAQSLQELSCVGQEEYGPEWVAVTLRVMHGCELLILACSFGMPRCWLADSGEH